MHLLHSYKIKCLITNKKFQLFPKLPKIHKKKKHNKSSKSNNKMVGRMTTKFLIHYLREKNANLQNSNHGFLRNINISHSTKKFK